MTGKQQRRIFFTKWILTKIRVESGGTCRQRFNGVHKKKVKISRMAIILLQIFSASCVSEFVVRTDYSFVIRLGQTMVRMFDANSETFWQRRRWIRDTASGLNCLGTFLPRRYQRRWTLRHILDRRWRQWQRHFLSPLKKFRELQLWNLRSISAEVINKIYSEILARSARTMPYAIRNSLERDADRRD